MATTKRVHVFATCIISGMAAIFTIISLVTEQWVVSNSIRMVLIDGTLSDQTNSVRYGLFKGTFFQKIPTYSTLQLTMECQFKDNICAVLCSGDSEILNILSKGGNVSDPMRNCPEVRRTTYRNRPISSYREDTTTTKKFINSGVWISTVIFLLLSLVFGVLSSTLALFNTVINPVEVFLSVHGLYLYNAIALCSSAIAMALWGVMHVTITYHNVAIYYTITGEMISDKVSNLGFSYWINIIPVVLYCGSVTVLYIRQYQLSKDPGHKLVQREENPDPVIYLY